MRYIVLALLLFATPAVAQQTSMQQELDSAQAQATTVISSFRQQIIADQNQIAGLKQQVAMLTKERDDLKTAADAAKKTADAPKEQPAPPK